MKYILTGKYGHHKSNELSASFEAQTFSEAEQLAFQYLAERFGDLCDYDPKRIANHVGSIGLTEANPKVSLNMTDPRFILAVQTCADEEK